MTTAQPTTPVSVARMSPAATSVAIGDQIESRDGYVVGTVAGIRPACGGDPRAYVLVLRSRLFGFLKDVTLVPHAWVQKRDDAARRITLSATGAEVIGSPRLRPDAEIRRDVAAALWPDGVLPQESRLRVSVTDGIVQLDGNTRSPRETLGARGLTRNVPGVLGVNGHLFDDETLTYAVAQALTQDPETRGAHLLVRSRMGAIDLSGDLPTTAASDKASALTRAVPGVTSLFNGAAVRAPLAAPDA